MMINNFTDKMQRCQQYIDALEEERRKIQVFSRELPLCLELVTQAIETYKQQLSGTTTEYNLNAQSDECSDDEHTSSDVPVLEEFIPLKRTFSREDEEEEEDDDNGSGSHKSKTYNNNTTTNNNSNSTSSQDNKNKKSDWLRSVQLWNQTSDPTPNEELTPKKISVVEVKKNGSGGAFHPFKKGKSAAAATKLPVLGVVPAAVASSTAENGGGSKKEDKDGSRKQRRCWSPELHRRFLQALQQLGGSHVATPKQIRELMKVDGLTNDEVKSHLQKYRLHTRRPSPSSIHNNNNHQQPPQFVVVGGIWVPPPEYAAMAAAASTGSGKASGVANSNGIYAPIANLPKGPLHDHASGGTLKQFRQHTNKSSCSEERGSHSHSDGGGVHSNSPATSSSTRTTTASPAD
ncbi:hypothetical protein RND71_002784 [Anisodus tanguticus]|uniref:HTH myb-type domain-containing protein n=1 Tax=Anisodus tanguticus TaxID=243964 RepID=A0AAE1SVK9_9SOLA|nr:hypothetical protein RND71_002784 [Anisodus tanguticus]